MTVDKIEELDNSLSVPSFEEELALSDIPRKMMLGYQREARLIKCPTCGVSVWVGPEDVFCCPKAPHDNEDDTESFLDNDEVELGGST